MIAIILAAGYGTRLHPLTLDCPKALLKLAGKPMIEYLVDDLATAHAFECIYVVTNDTFASQFKEWMDNYRASSDGLNIVLVNNGISDSAINFGAVHNLHLVLTEMKIDDDVIVVAADNLFSDGLSGFAQMSQQYNTPVVGIYDIEKIQDCEKYSSLDVDQNGRVTYFKEKPNNPKGTTIGIGLYYYPKSSLSLIDEFIAERHVHDQPGRLVEWMHSRTPFYTWRVSGYWFDIGSKQALEKADRFFVKTLQSNA